MFHWKHQQNCEREMKQKRKKTFRPSLQEKKKLSNRKHMWNKVVNQIKRKAKATLLMLNTEF